MAKIHSIKIKNFRCINEFEQIFYKSDFICLIGRGDSGKTTILDAISYVLSPNWNLTFYDSDFYNCNIESGIEIEASLICLPEKLISENKFGLYIRGVDKNTSEIHDELEDDHEKVLTIRLEVKKDLEPKWYVINDRQEAKLISAYDRAELNVFMISDFIDRHFSWNKGNPLYSLLKQEETSEEIEDDNIILQALRGAKLKIDSDSFKEFDSVTNKIKAKSTELGINISKTKTTIDFKDIIMKDGRVCLHEDTVPFRLKGKGSKRLISIAIQMALAESKGIILIDEFEYGLEPDRVQHLANTLKRNNKDQIFITTHSRDVLVELETDDIFLFKKEDKSLITFKKTLQGCLRQNPEAFFAKRIIVCEGSTEIGICRSLNKYRIKQGKENVAFIGIRFANGSGNQSISYCTGFNISGFPTCLFCDSDDSEINNKKEELKSSGVKIIDWEDGDCIEVAIVKYLPFEGVQGLLELAANIKLEESHNEEIGRIRDEIWESVKSKSSGSPPSGFNIETDNTMLRKAIGEAAKVGKWFKSQTKGEFLGDLIFKHFEQIGNNKLKNQLNELSLWIDEH